MQISWMIFAASQTKDILTVLFKFE